MIGLALLPSFSGAAVDAPPPNALIAGPTARDGVWLEATLPVSGAPHVVVPFLGGGEQAASLQYTVTVYSELPLEDAQPVAVATAGGDAGAPFECELCEGGHGSPCPFREIVEKMDKMEALMDERLRFLNTLCVPC